MRFLLLILIATKSIACPEVPVPSKPEKEPNAALVELVKILNSERAQRGLGALKIDPKLSCAAQMHSEDVGPKKLCQHDGTDGSSPWDRAKQCGTSARSENIACGHRSPRAAIDGWLKSPGHYKNMMSPKIKWIGVGESNFYWTNIFR